MKSFVLFDRDSWKVCAEFVAAGYDAAVQFSNSRGFTEENGYEVILKSEFWG